MSSKAPNSKRRVIFFAPYQQCERALYASAMASFIVKRMVDIRKYDFEYVTLDRQSDYCSPLIDHTVHRVVSPNDFKSHLRSTTAKGDPIICKAVYWFEYNKQYLDLAKHCQNYLFGDYTKWDWDHIRGSGKYSATIFPANNIAERMKCCLVNCYKNHAIYASSFRTLTPIREGLLEPNQIRIVLSMCSIQNPQNRLAILQNVAAMVKERKDLFITLLMDGISFTGEKEIIETLGLEYSDRCLVLNNFSDYEYLNILRQHDVFLDLNPVNGIGYLLTAAIHQGVFVGGFDQMLYRDILDNGKFGLLFKGKTKEYGYQFDRIIPNWDSLFSLLNKKVFNRSYLHFCINRRNECPHYQQTIEQRVGPFLNMWDYFSNLKQNAYSFQD